MGADQDGFEISDTDLAVDDVKKDTQRNLVGVKSITLE